MESATVARARRWRDLALAREDAASRFDAAKEEFHRAVDAESTALETLFQQDFRNTKCKLRVIMLNDTDAVVLRVTDSGSIAEAVRVTR